MFDFFEKFSRVTQDKNRDSTVLAFDSNANRVIMKRGGSLSFQSLFEKNTTRKKVKSRLSTFVDIHDPHTLEINTSFDLAKEDLRGETEVVMFFPKSLKVAEIPKASLWGDFQNRIRLSSRGRERKVRMTVEEVVRQMNSLIPLIIGEVPPTVREEETFTHLCQRLGIIVGDWISSHQISTRKKLSGLIEVPTPEELAKLI